MLLGWAIEVVLVLVRFSFKVSTTAIVSKEATLIDRL
jgi:hypothetical protein